MSTAIEKLKRPERANPLILAHQFQPLIDEGWTQQAIANHTGYHQTYVANSLRLLALPDPIQSLLNEGRLSRAHGVTLCWATLSQDEVVRFVDIVLAEKWTVARLEAEVRELTSGRPKRRRNDRAA